MRAVNLSKLFFIRKKYEKITKGGLFPTVPVIIVSFSKKQDNLFSFNTCITEVYKILKYSEHKLVTDDCIPRYFFLASKF